MMERVFLLILIVLSTLGALAQSENAVKNSLNNKRSDTLDVLDYKLWMDFRNMQNSEIQASCRVKFQTKLPDINSISLDLLALQIDSIKQGNQLISFTYNDTLIVASLTDALEQGAIDSVTVFYQGNPLGDASGWGGFYSSGNYAYNLGVGFAADPHNYGRVWHPCFDNFVERATYDITLVTDGLKRGYSNGFIAHDDVSNPNEIVRRWIMEEPIPTYLACVGVANYVHVDQEYQSPLFGTNIPMMLIAEPADTSNMKSSFVNLGAAMEIYEENYGPYVWNKVGFALVPFNSGAMEHASCIMYPRVAANGTLSFETLMAHELAHHWWGNLVTCRTATDMWINEGMARYSEAIFLEDLYGYESYINEMKKVHRKVLQQAHINDEGFLPISGVPHSATYGTHSYDKGATVVHNLRTYMGDDDFFAGLKAIQTDFAFSDIDAADFRDKLLENTSTNMTHFFDDWVYRPGFPGFVIDSFNVASSSGMYEVEVYVQQKLRGTDEFYRNVPLEISFMNNNLDIEHRTMYVSEQYTSAVFSLGFIPELIYLNHGDKILNAVTGESEWATSNTTFFKDYAYMRLVTSGLNVEDTAFVRVEHCRVAPDAIKNYQIYDEYQISTERYWRVDGIWPDHFSGGAWFFYDARDNVNGNLDNDLLSNPYGTSFIEDSLVMFWRPNSASDWSIHPDYTLHTQGSSTDGSGRIVVNQLLKGEYAFGYHFGATSLPKHELVEPIFAVYPNPSEDYIRLDIHGEHVYDEYRVIIRDVAGGVVVDKKWKNGDNIDIQQLDSGSYFVNLQRKNMPLGTVKFIKK